MPESNSSTLFGDVALSRALRSEVVPRLRTWPSVRVWHSGIESGQEIYATAIILREEGLLERATIWATDPDPARVRNAACGDFPAGAWARAAEGYAESGGRSALEEYGTVQGGRLVMRELLRERLGFFEHDVCTDASFNEFQLVLYRSPAAHAHRARALDVVHESLCRFGMLVLANGARVEHHPMSIHYEALLPGRWAYRRIG